MSYRTRLFPRARAEIRALSAYLRGQALQIVEELGGNPRPPRAKQIGGDPDFYRIWLAGRWRIAYRVDDGNEVISILRLRRKEEMDFDNLPWEMDESHSVYDSVGSPGGADAAEDQGSG